MAQSPMAKETGQTPRVVAFETYILRKSFWKSVFPLLEAYIKRFSNASKQYI